MHEHEPATDAPGGRHAGRRGPAVDRAGHHRTARRCLSVTAYDGSATAGGARPTQSALVGEPGSRLLLTDIAAGTCSVLEHAYLDRVERPHRLARASRQVSVAMPGGSILRDVEYDELDLVVELDGRLFHDEAEQHDRDLERDLDTAVTAKHDRSSGLGPGARPKLLHRSQGRAARCWLAGGDGKPFALWSQLHHRVVSEMPESLVHQRASQTPA